MTQNRSSSSCLDCGEAENVGSSGDFFRHLELCIIYSVEFVALAELYSDVSKLNSFARHLMGVHEAWRAITCRSEMQLEPSIIAAIERQDVERLVNVSTDKRKGESIQQNGMTFSGVLRLRGEVACSVR